MTRAGYEYANCAECGQVRQRQTLNDIGLCPWCLLTVILTTPNPLLQDPLHR
jgi:hypothetical protein